MARMVVVTAADAAVLQNDGGVYWQALKRRRCRIPRGRRSSGSMEGVCEDDGRSLPGLRARSLTESPRPSGAGPEAQGPPFRTARPTCDFPARPVASEAARLGARLATSPALQLLKPAGTLNYSRQSCSLQHAPHLPDTVHTLFANTQARRSTIRAGLMRDTVGYGQEAHQMNHYSLC
jgi:hypothetical protein